GGHGQGARGEAQPQVQGRDREAPGSGGAREHQPADRGANIEIRRDFQLPGELPFLWRRHYDSSKCDRMFALGRGNTHEYDRWLEFDLDGLRYTGVLDDAIKFPPVLNDGARCAAGGFVLRRINL